MKSSAGITLYNPDNSVFDKIKLYAEFFDTVLVFDNSADNNSYHNIVQLLPKNVFYYFNGKNDGLSKAYNFFLSQSSSIKNDTLCILDQDSFLDASNVKKLLGKVELVFSEDNSIAIIGPNIDYGENNKVNDDLFVDYVISSGSCYKLNYIINNDLYFDENYFIDNVDVDFCYQTTKKGFKVLQTKDATLIQQLGEGSFSQNNHSPIRHYYMFRNDFYFYKKKYKGLKYTFKIFVITSRHLVHIVLFENNKSRKIRSFFVAKKDYKNKKMGIISDDSFKKIS